MISPPDLDASLAVLTTAIRAGDAATAFRLLAAAPVLAKMSFRTGATRAAPRPVYAGETALHAAAAAYQTGIARRLISLGADIRARNRRGAEPLHFAAVGQPDAVGWNPQEQAATIALLIDAGADPNATDKGGATPLHKAVRTRCAAAVKALLDHSADPFVPNGGGSTPLRLASLTTGRGGSGSAAAKAQQLKILQLLRERGAG